MSTQISWCDETWPLTTGCTKVSEGCRSCYACRLAATRLNHLPQYKGLAFVDKTGILSDHTTYNWTGEVRLHPELLDAPARWRKPRRVFVCHTSDLFHEGVPDDFIWKAFSTMGFSNGYRPYKKTYDPRHHTYLILTKRAEHMHQFMLEFYRQHANIAPNIHLGVSVSTQDEWDHNVPLLMETPAAVRFVSLEPQIEEVRLRVPDLRDRPRLNGVIQGCESGPNRRPFNIQWAREMCHLCKVAGIPYYLKQIQDKHGKVIHLPELDGVTWQQYPK